MDRKWVKITALCIAIVFIVVFCVSISTSLIYGATADQEYIEAQQKKEEAQKNLNKTAKKKVETLSDMESIEKEAGALQSEIDGVNAKIEETDKRLKEEEVKLEEAKKEAQRKYDVFKERFRIMCEEGPTSYLELLFSAESFSDFVDKLNIAQEVSSYDKKIFDEMEAVKEQIQKSYDEIEAMKEQQLADKKDLDVKKSGLDAKLKEQQRLVAELEKDAKAYQRVIDEEQANMDRLKAMVSGSLSKSDSSSYVGGEFLWPATTTYITSHFSPNRKNPVTGIWKKHTGVDIGASFGTNIYAANSGTVTLAGWYSGYGNCVIIDHGGGKSTLYAHMSTIGCSNGQSVTKGQIIGKVGSTGNSTGPHLHFEIMINGTAVDPMTYF